MLIEKILQWASAGGRRPLNLERKSDALNFCALQKFHDVHDIFVPHIFIGGNHHWNFCIPGLRRTNGGNQSRHVSRLHFLACAKRQTAVGINDDFDHFFRCFRRFVDGWQVDDALIHKGAATIRMTTSTSITSM